MPHSLARSASSRDGEGVRSRSGRTRVLAVASVTAFALMGAACTESSPSPTGSSDTSTGSLPLVTKAPTGKEFTMIVETENPADATKVAETLQERSLPVTSINTAVGMVTAIATDENTVKEARSLPGVKAAARDRILGWAPEESEADTKAPASAPSKAPVALEKPVAAGKPDPLDKNAWHLRVVKAVAAQKVTKGKGVTVGIMDTGVDGRHPDLAPNFDSAKSRNFTVDMPEIDGPCEATNCVDPADVDDDGHGTHVAGIVAAADNGIGITGIAPEATIVNVRAGQDSGEFFLGPTVNALTYSGDIGLDVVNMSFFIDPWMWICRGGAEEDTKSEAAYQDIILDLMDRALTYAHKKGVTLVAAAGNENMDMSKPGVDQDSPNFGGDVRDRRVAVPKCTELPSQHENVISVAAVGESVSKTDYSNWTSKPNKTSITIAAPGGGEDAGAAPEPGQTRQEQSGGGAILSTMSFGGVSAQGLVKPDGAPNADARLSGASIVCPANKAPDANPCGYYAELVGTSMASPMVAGTAALVVAQQTKVAGAKPSPDKVTSILTKTATPTACPPAELYAEECRGGAGDNGYYGAGIVNAERAIKP